MIPMRIRHPYGTKWGAVCSRHLPFFWSRELPDRGSRIYWIEYSWSQQQRLAAAGERIAE